MFSSEQYFFIKSLSAKTQCVAKHGITNAESEREDSSVERLFQIKALVHLTFVRRKRKSRYWIQKAVQGLNKY